MIGALKGIVFAKTQNPIILFVGDVGYAVHVTDRFLEETTPEKEVFLFIHSHIREDAFDLFGFKTKEELNVFEMLLGVSGVGPKTALSVLQEGADAIYDAIQNSDVAFFTTIPRLGKKNAQKIIIELKNKIGSTKDLDLTEVESTETKDLLAALAHMGFSKSEIATAIRSLPKKPLPLGEKVKFCLQVLGEKV
jgi:Holliday junction DNA helicase RuvA